MREKRNTECRRAAFVSLGCFKNTVDSEVLAGMLQERGLAIVSEYENPDWLIINTCGFIRDAKEESIDEILAALEKKEKGEIRHLAVFGCLIQRYHRELREHLRRRRYPLGRQRHRGAGRCHRRRPADRLPGPGVVPLYRHASTPDIHYGQFLLHQDFRRLRHGMQLLRHPADPRPLPLADDPIHPQGSRSAEKKRRGGIEPHFPELHLFRQGQGRQPRCFPALLKAVSALGFRWLRVLYLMPEEVTPEILDGFDRPSVLPYFDLPFQHVAAAHSEKNEARRRL